MRWEHSPPLQFTALLHLNLCGVVFPSLAAARALFRIQTLPRLRFLALERNVCKPGNRPESLQWSCNPLEAIDITLRERLYSLRARGTSFDELPDSSFPALLHLEIWTDTFRNSLGWVGTLPKSLTTLVLNCGHDVSRDFVALRMIATSLAQLTAQEVETLLPRFRRIVLVSTRLHLKSSFGALHNELLDLGTARRFKVEIVSEPLGSEAELYDQEMLLHQQVEVGELFFDRGQRVVQEYFASLNGARGPRS